MYLGLSDKFHLTPPKHNIYPGLPDGLHPTPPMGWTSWNTFFEFNSESKMISQETNSRLV